MFLIAFKRRLIGPTLMSAIAAGCATAPNISGESTASPKLKSDASAFVSLQTKAITRCESVESIRTEVLMVAPNLKGNAAGAVTSGRIQERWTATACGQSIPYLITFAPDGVGGTFIGVTREK